MMLVRASLRALPIVLSVSVVWGGDVYVIASGAFVEAFAELIPIFERATQNKVIAAFGASVASAPNSVQKRLERGERAGVIVVDSNSLDRLITERRIVPETKVDIAVSRIGAVVRAGMPKPDISSADALRQTLLMANSIAYSSGLSGVYVSTELFPRLGIADALKGKLRRIEGARVGAAVARGDADIGFQQISELIHVPGIQYVGPLPADAQKIATISVGIATDTRDVVSAQAFIRFLSSPTAVGVMAKHGLDSIGKTTGPRPTP